MYSATRVARLSGDQGRKIMEETKRIRMRNRGVTRIPRDLIDGSTLTTVWSSVHFISQLKQPRESFTIQF